jgi:choline dehydrogenase-like flavoprotein
MMNGVPHNEDGASGSHLYMPWWGDNKKLDFPRGYHIELGGGRRMPGFGTLSGAHLYHTTAGDGGLVQGGGYGKQLKDDYRRFYGATVGFAGRGEMIPNENSYCEIDPTVVDRWGIPVLRFHWQWTDYELKQVKHMQETFRSIINEMGGVPMTPMPSADAGYGIEPGGRIIHEVGCVRMGNDPKTSVLNSNCQAHDCRNLFLTDGGPFVTNPDKNVTWTILALAMRTSEYIAEQRKAGAL